MRTREGGLLAQLVYLIAIVYMSKRNLLLMEGKPARTQHPMETGGMAARHMLASTVKCADVHILNSTGLGQDQKVLNTQAAALVVAHLEVDGISAGI